MPYPKPCERCGKRFKPSTHSHRLCYKCISKSRLNGLNTKRKKIKYSKVLMRP